MTVSNPDRGSAAAAFSPGQALPLEPRAASLPKRLRRQSLCPKTNNFYIFRNEALAKYEKVASDIEAINNKYIEEFEECYDDDYMMEEVHYVELIRISNINATLGHKDFIISYGK